MDEMTYEAALDNKKFIQENIRREQHRILQLAKEMSKSVCVVDEYKELLEQCERVIIKYEVHQELKGDSEHE